jgi:hypothetical protein
MHDQVRLSRGAYDQIINDVIPIIEEMLGHVGQRPDAPTARSRFRAALDTALRISYPGPFQVSPVPSPPPPSPARPGDVLGLRITYSPTQQVQIPLRGQNQISPSPALASSSELSNGLHESSIDNVVSIDQPRATPNPLSRSLTDQQVHVPNIRSPSPQRAPGQTPVRDRGSSAPETNTRNSVQFVDQQWPGSTTTAPDRQTLHATSSQNQPTTNEHRSDLTKTVLFATIPQVLHWIQEKKLKRFLPPTSPVLDDKLEPLRGTDQVRTLVLTTHMN